MRCPACGTDNDLGRKFCRECGTPLAVACLTCGSPDEPGVKFCGECGSALNGAAAAADATPTAGLPAAQVHPGEAAEVFGRLKAVPWLDRVARVPAERVAAEA